MAGIFQVQRTILGTTNDKNVKKENGIFHLVNHSIGSTKLSLPNNTFMNILSYLTVTIAFYIGIWKVASSISFGQV